MAVEHAAGVETHPVDENLVAGATFCQPQVASVGITEAQAKEAGHDVKIGKYKLGGVGAAPSTTTGTGWSRSSSTPSTARSSAPTSSVTEPAT